jgi:hypothetical protein
MLHVQGKPVAQIDSGMRVLGPCSSGALQGLCKGSSSRALGKLLKEFLFGLLGPLLVRMLQVPPMYVAR